MIHKYFCQHIWQRHWRFLHKIRTAGLGNDFVFLFFFKEKRQFYFAENSDHV
jgi:hypothetical protein